MISFYENATHIVLTGEEDEINDMVAEMAFRADGYYFAPSFKRFIASGGQQGWDGFMRPLQRLTQTSARAMRGHKSVLIKLARMLKFKVNLDRLLPSVFSDINPEDVEPNLIAGEFELDPRQRECIYNWLREAVGINKVTVSGGKTAMFAGAAAFIKTRFPEARVLYISQAERLIRQVTKEMRKFLPKWDIGQFGGGHQDFEAQDMVVATVAMLNRHFNSLKGKGWFDEFMVLLYDEVHHCASPTSEKIVLEIPAYFRLGASDGVKEAKKDRHSRIKGLFGPILTEIGVAPLVKEQRVAEAIVYIVRIPWTDEFKDTGRTAEDGSTAHVLYEGEWIKGIYRGPVYEVYTKGPKKGEHKTKEVRDVKPDADGCFGTHDEPIVVQGLQKVEIDKEVFEIASRWCLLDRTYDRCIIRYRERNQLIVEWCQHFASRNLTTLIVCTRTLHIYILEALLRSSVNDPEKIKILFGHDGVAARDRTFEWFRNTPGAILITPLIKEGVSINEIQAGIVADYVGDRETANQLIGRFIRKKYVGHNVAEIVWFSDNHHPTLQKGSSRVLAALRKHYPYRFVGPLKGPESLRTTPVPRTGGLSPH